MDIFIFPDSHTRQGEDNVTRFEAAGNYIVHHQPDIIVDLGDHWDFPSLSSYDEGLEAMEGQRYEDDVLAGQEAFDAFQDVIDRYNRGRKVKYKPRKEFIFGNHEQRLEKFLQKNPKFRKTIGLDKLGLKERGWNTTAYREKLYLEGFVFTHHFVNRVGRPLSSASNIGNTIYNKESISGIQGHNHLLQYSYNVGGDGRKYLSGSFGWFGALDQVEGYAKDTMHGWWNGITVLKDVSKGYGDIEVISQERLLKEYL